MNNTSKILTALLGGIALGAILGVLFAPDKGTETRRKMADTAKKATDTVRNKFNNTIKKAKEAMVNEEEEELI